MKGSFLARSKRSGGSEAPGSGWVLKALHLPSIADFGVRGAANDHV